MPTCQQPSARSLGDGIKSTRRLKVNFLFVKPVFLDQWVVASLELMPILDNNFLNKNLYDFFIKIRFLTFSLKDQIGSLKTTMLLEIKVKF